MSSRILTQCRRGDLSRTSGFFSPNTACVVTECDSRSDIETIQRIFRCEIDAIEPDNVVIIDRISTVDSASCPDRFAVDSEVPICEIW